MSNDKWDPRHLLVFTIKHMKAKEKICIQKHTQYFCTWTSDIFQVFILNTQQVKVHFRHIHTAVWFRWGSWLEGETMHWISARYQNISCVIHTSAQSGFVSGCWLVTNATASNVDLLTCSSSQPSACAATTSYCFTLTTAVHLFYRHTRILFP